MTDPVEPLDGISLVPLIEGKMKERPSPIGFWHHNGKADFTAEAGWAALSDNRYKLHRMAKGEYELYDLVNDPQEKRDLAASQPQVVEKMKVELAAWQTSVIASFEGKNYVDK